MLLSVATLSFQFREFQDESKHLGLAATRQLANAPLREGRIEARFLAPKNKVGDTRDFGIAIMRKPSERSRLFCKLLLTHIRYGPPRFNGTDEWGYFWVRNLYVPVRQSIPDSERDTLNCKAFLLNYYDFDAAAELAKRSGLPGDGPFILVTRPQNHEAARFAVAQWDFNEVPEDEFDETYSAFNDALVRPDDGSIEGIHVTASLRQLVKYRLRRFSQPLAKIFELSRKGE